MEEYVCVTVLGNAGESQEAFRAKLTEFWTHMLRHQPDDYEAVYAELTAFETVGDCSSRRYMVEVGGVPALLMALMAAGIALQPVDPDDVYNKYEASGSEWFQIEH